MSSPDHFAAVDTPAGVVRCLGRLLLVPAVLFYVGLTVAPAIAQTAGSPLVKEITILTNDGGRVAWSKSLDLIAFDRKDADDFFDIFTMLPDGSQQQCLTCDHPALPNKHIGNPSWHPSGDYIAIQVQNEAPGLGGITNFFANPGAGLNNNLWVMDRAGENYWQFTDVRSGVGGVLHPHFSHDGTRVLWAERVSSQGGSTGTWVLRLADFLVEEGTPSIQNIETLTPGAQQIFYESHGFSPDDQRIYFSGTLTPGQEIEGIDIYSYDLNTRDLVNLSQTLDEWDEHSQITPDGQTILWMSSRGYEVPGNLNFLSTDYWLGSRDGARRTRLTFFNEPGQPEYIPGAVAAADSDWNADGTRIVAYLIEDPAQLNGSIALIELRELERVFFFPQVGDGVSGDDKFQTEVIVINGDQDNRVRIEFFNSAGAPLTLSLGSLGMDSVFEIPLQAGHSFGTISDGTSALQVGYARVRADSNVDVNLIFTRSQAPEGIALTRAGVPSSDPLMEFTLYIDSIGDSDTGVALVNLGDETAQIVVNLFDEMAGFVSSVTIALPPGNHTAQFIWEIFATDGQEEVATTAQEMKGVVTFSSIQPVAALTLRQNGGSAVSFPSEVPTLTTLPVIPGITVQPDQTP